MKCINKKRLLAMSVALLLVCSFLTGCQKEKIEVTSYETGNYSKELYRGELFAQDLCVVTTDITESSYVPGSTALSRGLFSLSDNSVLYAEQVHDMIYPASTTKIMTALVALDNGNLDDIVTVGPNGDVGSFNYDEQVSGLKEGDQLTLRDLLHGLLMYSGNDTAVAVAEHIGGSVENFCQMMNDKAQDLMATHTHFVNPHGLHDDDHYTTAYDMYLMFNQALQYEVFMEIIQKTSYDMQITGADNSPRTITCTPTSFYALGETAQPQGATVIGGKTGTTGEAGCCLVLYDVDSGGNPYISIIMGAETKPLLYSEMTALINSISGD